MAISITHTTVAALTDAGGVEIGKTQWNANHSLSMATARLLGRTTASDGAPEEISVTANLLLTAASLNTVQAITTTSGPSFAAATLSSADPALTMTDTDTGSDAIIDVAGTSGTLRIRADANNEVADSTITFEVDGTQRGYMNAAGDLFLNGGVQLGGNTDVLDVYEEGTFTPVTSFNFGTTGWVISEAGKYTRIGNMVHYSMISTITTVGSSTGSLRISGWPYTSGAFGTVSSGYWIMTGCTLGAGQEDLQPFTLASEGRAQGDMLTATGRTAINDADVTTGTVIYVTGSYATDAA